MEEKAAAASSELSESFEAEEVHCSFLKFFGNTVFHSNSTWSKFFPLFFSAGTRPV